MRNGEWNYIIVSAVCPDALEAGVNAHCSAGGYEPIGGVTKLPVDADGLEYKFRWMQAMKRWEPYGKRKFKEPSSNWLWDETLPEEERCPNRDGKYRCWLLSGHPGNHIMDI